MQAEIQGIRQKYETERIIRYDSLRTLLQSIIKIQRGNFWSRDHKACIIEGKKGHKKAILVHHKLKSIKNVEELHVAMVDYVYKTTFRWWVLVNCIFWEDLEWYKEITIRNREPNRQQFL